MTTKAKKESTNLRRSIWIYFVNDNEPVNLLLEENEYIELIDWLEDKNKHDCISLFGLDQGRSIVLFRNGLTRIDFPKFEFIEWRKK